MTEDLKCHLQSLLCAGVSCPYPFSWNVEASVFTPSVDTVLSALLPASNSSVAPGRSRKSLRAPSSLQESLCTPASPDCTSVTHIVHAGALRGRSGGMEPTRSDFTGPESCMEVFENGVETDIITCNTAMRAYEEGGRRGKDTCERAEMALESSRMGRNRLEADAIEYNAAISACERDRERVETQALVSRMGKNRLEADTIKYNATISACERDGRSSATPLSPSCAAGLPSEFSAAPHDSLALLSDGEGDLTAHIGDLTAHIDQLVMEMQQECDARVDVGSCCSDQGHRDMQCCNQRACDDVGSSNDDDGGALDFGAGTQSEDGGTCIDGEKLRRVRLLISTFMHSELSSGIILAQRIGQSGGSFRLRQDLVHEMWNAKGEACVGQLDPLLQPHCWRIAC